MALYFYGQKGGHGYLSQFHNSNFVDEEGNEFFHCEQWMMLNKAKLFEDEESAIKILKERNAAKIKGLGRNVRWFKQKIWNKNRSIIVIKGNYLKFSQNEQLKKNLLDTGDRELVEATPSSDRIWGIGYRAHEVPENRSLWGLNLLGKALMEVRSMLLQEDKK